MVENHSEELSKGDRFHFGANWQAFLNTVDNDRVNEAVDSLKNMLNVENLTGCRFLDIGSGSGLFSLAAVKLGATVLSFDFDSQSVECAKELRALFDSSIKWTIEEGSVLDEQFIRSLGKFDVVYSWGVLHHTGNLSMALENAIIPVDMGSTLFIAIYNDQDFTSNYWEKVKKMYCSSILGKLMVSIVFIPIFFLQSVCIGVIKYRNPLGNFKEYNRKRGMSIYHDWVDWLGGYPFEVAKPEEIISFYSSRGFKLVKLITTNRLGCNQFVFKKQG